jgi:hypothetical protein
MITTSQHGTLRLLLRLYLCTDLREGYDESIYENEILVGQVLYLLPSGMNDWSLPVK